MATARELAIKELELTSRSKALDARERMLSEQPPVKDLAHERSVSSREKSVVSKEREADARLDAVRLKERVVRQREDAVEALEHRLTAHSSQLAKREQEATTREQQSAQHLEEATQRLAEADAIRRQANEILTQARTVQDEAQAEAQRVTAAHVDRVNADTARLASWEQELKNQAKRLAEQAGQPEGLLADAHRKYTEATSLLDTATSLERHLKSLESALTLQKTQQDETQTRLMEEQRRHAEGVMKARSDWDRKDAELRKRELIVEQKIATAGLRAEISALEADRSPV